MHDLTGIGELVLDKELDKKEARKKGAGDTKRQKMQQQQDESRCLSKIRLQKERVKSVRVSKRCARKDRRLQVVWSDKQKRKQENKTTRKQENKKINTMNNCK